MRGTYDEQQCFSLDQGRHRCCGWCLWSRFRLAGLADSGLGGLHGAGLDQRQRGRSGSAAAAAKGKWSSAVARAGIWHKGGTIVVVLVAAVADCVLGMAVEHFPVLGIDYTVLVLPVILVWYIFTELGSIAENATDMGAPVPAWLTKLLAAGKQLAEQQLDLPDDTDNISK